MEPTPFISLAAMAAMVLVFFPVLVKVRTPPRPQLVAPFAPGQFATLHASLVVGAQPGTPISVESMRARCGRITLTAHELIWEPDDRAIGSWRSPLADVRLIERPSFATRRLVLLVQGRPLCLVVDVRPPNTNTFSKDFLAEHRQARLGAWFADQVNAGTARAWASP